MKSWPQKAQKTTTMKFKQNVFAVPAGLEADEKIKSIRLILSEKLRKQKC
jgi:hypothetical protein